MWGDCGAFTIQDAVLTFQVTPELQLTVVMNKTTNHPASRLAGAIQPYWPNSAVAQIEFYLMLFCVFLGILYVLTPIYKDLSTWPERKLREV